MSSVHLCAVLLAGLTAADRPLAQLDLPLVKVRQNGAIHAVAFAPDGKVLASAGTDGIVRLTDPTTGKELRRLTTTGEVRALAFSPDGKLLATKNARGPFTLFDPATGAVRKTYATHGSNSTTIAFSPDGNALIGAAPMEYEYWEHNRGGMSSSRSSGWPEGSFAAVSPDGKTVAWGQPAGHIQLLQPRGGMFRSLQAGPSRSAAFSPDGKLLATGQPDGGIRLWNLENLKEVRRLYTPAAEETRFLAFSADSSTLVAGGGKRALLRVWDLNANQEVRRIAAQRSPVQAMALSADARFLATGAADQRVRVWDLKNAAPTPPPARDLLAAAELEALYTELAGDDPVRSRLAFATLLASPRHSVPFLEQRIRPAARLTIDDRVSQLLGKLDADEFDIRERATEELATLGEAAAAALRQALSSSPSAEVRARVTKLLKRLKDEPALSPELLRVLEAIEVLEHVGTPQARQALEGLARESLQARILSEVRGALDRLAQ